MAVRAAAVQVVVVRAAARAAEARAVVVQVEVAMVGGVREAAARAVVVRVEERVVAKGEVAMVADSVEAMAAVAKVGEAKARGRQQLRRWRYSRSLSTPLIG